jgi:DMSO/TMAO reductase YedYZ molybdopterin-dependent catalytic subunit
MPSRTRRNERYCRSKRLSGNTLARTSRLFPPSNHGSRIASNRASQEYKKLQADGFKDWKLSVEGSVKKERTFSLAELKALPSRMQITRHACEEGWSAIGEWTAFSCVTCWKQWSSSPARRFLVYTAYDDWVDSMDLLDAFHPQTILAYGMNGRDLPVPHGAPVRLRLETQLGAKSLKFLNRLVVVDEFDDGGPEGAIQNGWSWYMGI